MAVEQLIVNRVDFVNTSILAPFDLLEVLKPLLLPPSRCRLLLYGPYSRIIVLVPPLFDHYVLRLVKMRSQTQLKCSVRTITEFYVGVEFFQLVDQLVGV